MARNIWNYQSTNQKVTYKSNTNDRHLKQRSLQYDHKNGGMIYKKNLFIKLNILKLSSIFIVIDN